MTDVSAPPSTRDRANACLNMWGWMSLLCARSCVLLDGRSHGVPGAACVRCSRSSCWSTGPSGHSVGRDTF
jgi:hypothetical protein